MKKSSTSKRKRPPIPTGEAFEVWVAAAGRCTFCNRLVLENEDLGEAVKVGQLAHNVGWGDGSPRGDEDLDPELRQLAENLILACASCHKPIDSKGVIDRYSVEELQSRKIEHETRVRELTAIDSGRAAYVIRFLGMVRGVPPELTRETVLDASTASGIYPKRLPWSHWQDYELDLRSEGDPETAADFERMDERINKFCTRLHDGVASSDIQRLAIFGFARIPLLVSLGARLDDKLRTSVFNRHRTDETNPWGWPKKDQTLKLATKRIQSGADSKKVALIISLSGTIDISETRAFVNPDWYVYEISPVEDVAPGPNLVQSAKDLAIFEKQAREFLSLVEAEHGKPDEVAAFPAIGVGPAVSLGRVLMADVSPALIIYDRDLHGDFMFALKVEA